MSGTTYDDMPLPKRLFRPDKDTRREDRKIRFESFDSGLREESERISLLRASVEDFPELFGDDVLDLARRLEEGVETHVPPQSMASYLYMRGVRMPLIGNVWSHAEDPELAPAVVGTLRPTGMWVRSNELPDQSPQLLTRRLEEDLRRREFPKMKGYLLAGLHAEFDVNRGGYDFHHHLVAGGEMAEALDSLRDIRRLKPGRVQPHEQGLPESPRVNRSREPLTNLPDPLTYLLQSWVPHRPTTKHPDGTLERGTKRRRIPEPYHTHWMLWMDRWKVSDFMFCMGMFPTTAGFQLKI